MATKCELCGSEHDILNFHHLIPVTLHTNKWYLKNYTKDFLKTHGIWICENHCHKQIHHFISEKDMGKEYNTVEKLLSHDKVNSYINWRKKRV